MKKSRPVCLTIAGFDPSGGAGILADIKTFEQFKVQGFAVQTANTIQTIETFHETNWISEEIILQQLDVLLKSCKVSHFKIGLIESAGILLKVLARIHASCDKPFIIWDPVLSASAGGTFNTHRFAEKLDEILSGISVITPNIPEFQLLFGGSSPEEMTSKHSVGIYLKGGHSDGKKGKDFYYIDEKIYPFNPRTKDKHNVISEKHGSGCVLSAALLSVNALGYPTVKGVLKSKEYVERFLSSAPSKLGVHS